MTKEIQADPLHDTTDRDRLSETIARSYPEVQMAMKENGLTTDYVFNEPLDKKLLNSGLSPKDIADFNHAYRATRLMQQFANPTALSDRRRISSDKED